MKYNLYIIVVIIPLFFFISCGSESSATKGSVYLEVPENAPCEGGQFYRLKTKECIPLKNPTWGFQGFALPAENLYTMQSCSENELETLIQGLPAEGGKIIMPECTI